MSPTTRRLVAVPIALLLAATAGAGGAWASHQFSDVPDGAFFHDSISNIIAAGCATGFNDGTFGMAQNATRGQFAFWTDNCGTRVSYDDSSSVLSANESVPPADTPVVKIEAGAVGDGAGHVVVLTSWTARPSAEENVVPSRNSGGPDIQFLGSIPCPCNVQTGVVATLSTSPANPDFAYSEDSWDRQDSGDMRRMSGSGMHVISLPAGENVELAMFGTYSTNEPGADDIELEMHITALYVPFGWDGSQALRPPPQEPT